LPNNSAQFSLSLLTKQCNERTFTKCGHAPDKRGFDLISDVLPFGRLWYGEPNAVTNAVNYAKFYSRSHDTVIRVYDEAGNVIGTHENAEDFREW
jgi:hypothetical protein